MGYHVSLILLPELLATGGSPRSSHVPEDSLACKFSMDVALMAGEKNYTSLR